MTVKLGIIGLGFIGQTHLRHSLKLQDAQVVAATDVSTKALQSAKELGVKKTFNNYADMLKDPEVDAVLISLPTHLHLKCAVDAAQAGKNIFLEKPIAVSVDEAKQIITAANKNAVKLMVGYPLRFNKTFLNLKNQLEMGSLGTWKTRMQPMSVQVLFSTELLVTHQFLFLNGGLTLLTQAVVC